MPVVLSEPCSPENELTRLDLLLDAARRAYSYALSRTEDMLDEAGDCEHTERACAACNDLQGALALYGIEV